MKWKEFTSREPGYSTLSGIERRRLRQAFDADKPNGVEDIMLKLRVVREFHELNKAVPKVAVTAEGLDAIKETLSRLTDEQLEELARIADQQAAAEQAAAEQAERERILALTPPTEEGGDPPLP
jgi:succinylarginine dihydrolase